MKINKTILCLMAGLLILTSFVSAEIFEDLVIEVNDVELFQGDRLYLPEGETSKITIEFLSQINSSDVIIIARFEGQGINVNEVTLPFDILEGSTYRKTLNIDIPSQINQEEYYSLVLEVQGQNDMEAILLHNGFNDNEGVCGFIGDPLNNLIIENINFENEGLSQKAFGENKEWFPFEKIEVEIEIENYGNQEIEEIAYLWGLYDTDLGEWVIELNGNEEGFTLEEDDTGIIDVSFSLNGNLAIDLDKLKEGDHYLFYFIVLGYDNEIQDLICNYRYESIRVIIESDFVVLDNLIIEPEIVKGGEQIKITSSVLNLGEDDQDDVSVRIYNESLGIDKTVMVGDVGAFSEEFFETNILIPHEAKPSKYLLEFSVIDEDNDVYENDYNDEESKFFEPITVQEYSDITSPIITIYDPDDNEDYKVDEDDEKEINFEYKVNDESEIDYCELIVDEEVEGKDTSVERYVKQEFEEDFDEGNYDWKIKCVDVYGNEAFSEERDFEIDERKEKKSSKNYEGFIEEVSYDKKETKDLEEQEVFPKEPIVLSGEEGSKSKINLRLDILLPILLGFAILVLLIIMVVVLRR